LVFCKYLIVVIFFFNHPWLFIWYSNGFSISGLWYSLNILPKMREVLLKLIFFFFISWNISDISAVLIWTFCWTRRWFLTQILYLLIWLATFYFDSLTLRSYRYIISVEGDSQFSYNFRLTWFRIIFPFSSKTATLFPDCIDSNKQERQFEICFKLCFNMWIGSWQDCIRMITSCACCLNFLKTLFQLYFVTISGLLTWCYFKKISFSL